ncbi:gag-pol polyprotein [Tanacetum coccineum]|uniref:Gag-pol polyprotein n=1 Tax=Tanacetum coccineum TaxID=301880 RepID=A0ABQ4X8K2_9ASTR
MGTVRFRNDHFAAITGYGDYVQGNLTICHVYYVEGLGHNLFSVGQFCDGDLEVAFPSNTCYVRNLEGGDLLTSSRKSNLYTIFISELAASSPVCLMSKATSTKSWVESINGKKYILVIVDDYSRYTWVYFLRTKDEAPDMIINFINQVQRNLKAQILKIRTDNGTELKNEKLLSFYAKLGIVHHTSIARTPQQNGVVERRNRTLVKAARAMLIFSKTPEFLWAEAIATTCFTQNRSLVHTRYNKTPYELIRGRKPNFQYFYVFGSLCYPINDCNDLGKMKPKADIVIFFGYFESSREEINEIPSQQDLDNLFGPLYEEYYALSTSEVLNNSAANTLDDEDTPSPSSIIVEDKDVAKLDGNTIMHSFEILEFEEAESSSNYQDPSNMHEFHQQHRYTDKWTKNHPIEQVIVSLTEPKNIKEAMLDHSWIESMQDELNQFKRLDVWELVPLPEGIHEIKVKWLWKNKTDAENMVIWNKSRLVAKGYSQ